MTNPFPAVTVSLHVSLLSTALCAAAGIPAGCALALCDFRGKNTLIALLNTLLALPTVVVGLFAYSLLRRNGILGAHSLLFTRGAIVIGQFVLALPIMVTFCHGAIAHLDPGARESARMLGAGPGRVALTLINEARFGIMAAVAATFGRLIGEVGISMMLGGNIAGVTRTMTTAIALETSKGEFTLGLQLGGILLAIALAVNISLRFLQGKAGSGR
jgi:tungstate transport system permease protein